MTFIAPFLSPYRVDGSHEGSLLQSDLMNSGFISLLVISNVLLLSVLALLDCLNNVPKRFQRCREHCPMKDSIHNIAQ